MSSRERDLLILFEKSRGDNPSRHATQIQIRIALVNGVNALGKAEIVRVA
jgi:hypothetical protein